MELLKHTQTLFPDVDLSDTKLITCHHILEIDFLVLKALFEKAVPDYDKESVYVSNMKSVFSWYNILVEKNLIDLEEEPEAAEDTKEAKSGETEENSPKEA